MNTDTVLTYVASERARQRRLIATGKIPHPCEATHVPASVKLSVLAEEFGEVARALNDGEGERALFVELVQCAAVAVAWAESLSQSARMAVAA